MLEWFVSGVDYNGVMDFAEELVSGVVERVMGTTKVTYDGAEIDFATPWKRITLREALLEETGADITELSRDEMAELAGEDAQPDDDWAALADTLQGKLVEPKLTQPTFIQDLPLDIWPLVKPVRECPSASARPSTGSSPGWRSPAAGPTSTTRSSSAAASSNSASGGSRGRSRTPTSTTKSSCGRSNTGCSPRAAAVSESTA
jgi:hypothetical protein